GESRSSSRIGSRTHERGTLSRSPAEAQQQMDWRHVSHARAECVSAKRSARATVALGGGGSGVGGMGHSGSVRRCNSEMMFRSLQPSQAKQQAKPRLSFSSVADSVTRSASGLQHGQKSTPTGEGVPPVPPPPAVASTASLERTHPKLLIPPPAPTLRPVGWVAPESSARAQPVSTRDSASGNRSIFACAASAGSAGSVKVAAKPTLGLTRVAEGGRVWRQSMAAAAEERRAKSRAAAATAAAAALPSSAAYANPTDFLPDGNPTQQGGNGNRKLSPEEQQQRHAANARANHWHLESQHARASPAVRRQWIDVRANGSRREFASAASAPTYNRTARPATAAAAGYTKQVTGGDADSGAGVARSSRRQCRTVWPTEEATSEHQAASDASAHNPASSAPPEEVPRPAVSDAAIAALLSVETSPVRPARGGVAALVGRGSSADVMPRRWQPDITRGIRLDPVPLPEQGDWREAGGQVEVVGGGGASGGARARTVGDRWTLPDYDEDE
ncbi:unnamed protein product, partial [Sphacelaria rigidula]